MSSVDTRYKEVWKHVQVYNRTKDPLWLHMIDSCTLSEDPLEAAAAEKVLSRYKKDRHVSNAH
jgi:hypothetical protein